MAQFSSLGSYPEVSCDFHNLSVTHENTLKQPKRDDRSDNRYELEQLKAQLVVSKSQALCKVEMSAGLSYLELQYELSPLRILQNFCANKIEPLFRSVFITPYQPTHLKLDIALLKQCKVVGINECEEIIVFLLGKRVALSDSCNREDMTMLEKIPREPLKSQWEDSNKEAQNLKNQLSLWHRENRSTAGIDILIQSYECFILKLDDLNTKWEAIDSVKQAISLRVIEGAERVSQMSPELDPFIASNLGKYANMLKSILVTCPEANISKLQELIQESKNTSQHLQQLKTNLDRLNTLIFSSIETLILHVTAVKNLYMNMGWESSTTHIYSDMVSQMREKMLSVNHLYEILKNCVRLLVDMVSLLSANPKLTSKELEQLLMQAKQHKEEFYKVRGCITELNIPLTIDFINTELVKKYDAFKIAKDLVGVGPVIWDLENLSTLRQQFSSQLENLSNVEELTIAFELQFEQFSTLHNTLRAGLQKDYHDQQMICESTRRKLSSQISVLIMQTLGESPVIYEEVKAYVQIVQSTLDQYDFKSDESRMCISVCSELIDLFTDMLNNKLLNQSILLRLINHLNNNTNDYAYLKGHLNLLKTNRGLHDQ